MVIRPHQAWAQGRGSNGAVGWRMSGKLVAHLLWEPALDFLCPTQERATMAAKLEVVTVIEAFLLALQRLKPWNVSESY